jgi:hypothetical protein
VPGGLYIDYLYFSIETLSTTGYGDRHPQTHYGHFIATFELFTGIFSMSLMTGLIFARFSRPSARSSRHPFWTSLRGGPRHGRRWPAPDRLRQVPRNARGMIGQDWLAPSRTNILCEKPRGRAKQDHNFCGLEIDEDPAAHSLG